MTHSLEAADVTFDPETKRWTAPRYTTRTFDSLGVETFDQFRNLDTLINLEVTELGRIGELIQTMRIGELNTFLEQQRTKGSDAINIIEVEKHARFAYPLSTFILTLIAGRPSGCPTSSMRALRSISTARRRSSRALRSDLRPAFDRKMKKPIP